MKKYLLIFCGIFVIFVICYFYASFYGLPWKKDSVAKKLESYVEEKYDIQVELVEKYYDFKGGSYGAKFVLKDNDKITFSAYQYHTGILSDEYPEAFWSQEVMDDVTPVLKQSFPTLNVKDYYAIPVYGMGDELVEGKEIPSYKEVNTEIVFAVAFSDKWTKETEETLIKESYEFITSLQEKGIKNLGVTFFLEKESEEGVGYFTIAVDGNEFNQIKTEEDVRKYIE